MIFILVGYMGAGKTSYAKQLSEILNMKYLDTDRLVEKMEGMTIPEIFKAKGEKYFRDAETKIIENLRDEDNAIVATGGGLPCFNDNMKLLNEIGLTIYLQVNVESVVSRLEKSHQKRPLVEGKSHDELIDFVRKNLGEREKYYKLAKITYDANERQASGLLAAINLLKK